MPGSVAFIVPGKVQPWQRAGTFRGRHYTPAKTRHYEQLVAHCAREAMAGRALLLGYVAVDLRIICDIPPSWRQSRKRAALAGDVLPTTGDLDNCCKSVADGMNGIVYGDDRQIVSLTVARRYGAEAMAYVAVEVVAQLPVPLAEDFRLIERLLRREAEGLMCPEAASFGIST